MITRRRLLGLSACIPALSIARPLAGTSRTNPVSTGDPELDQLLKGGYQRTRITQIFNDPVGDWLLPFRSTEVALGHGLRVSWIAQDRQMIADYATTVGYDVHGVRVSLVERLEPALAAMEQAARESDLVVAFASLAELPSDFQEPPCKLIRRLARALRRTNAAVLVITDGDEAQVESTQAGRAIRFYAATRIRVDRDYFEDDFEAAVVKYKGYCTGGFGRSTSRQMS